MTTNGNIHAKTIFPERLEGRRIVVLGAGRSGRAAAALLARENARVALVDDQPDAVHPEELDDVMASHVELFLGEGERPSLEKAEGLVVSPGIALTHPLVVEAGEKGLAVIGELELGSRFIQEPFVAVTGTNGKTTTACWIAHLLKTGGRQAVLCGNVGTAMSGVVGSPADWFVLEVSSFQLETIERFRPRVAVILNLSEDHIDRHPTAEAYLASKARIGMNQSAEDVLVLNADDKAVWSLANSAPATVWGFSLEGPLDRGAWIEGDRVVVRRGPDASPEMLMPVSEVALPGRHNLANALAAAVAALNCGLAPVRIREGLGDFAGVEHRLERVAEIGGVPYVNDSKATNIASLEVALLSFETPIVLLAGGRGKGAPYEPLVPLVARTVRRLIAFGEDAERLEAAFGGHVETERVADLGEALARANAVARPGETVLLSPACASFDQYRNYEERGRHFKNLVLQLERKS